MLRAEGEERAEKQEGSAAHDLHGEERARRHRAAEQEGRPSGIGEGERSRRAEDQRPRERP